MTTGQALPDGFAFKRLLTRGGLSSVWLATQDGHPVVVKVFRRDPEWTDEQNQECYSYFLNEAHYLKDLSHDRVVRGLGTIQIGDELCILLQYLAGVDLRTWMDTHRPPRSFEHFWRIAASTAKGLRYVHSRGLIHRDVAPRNVMVDDYFAATLIDFQFTCRGPSTAACQGRGDESPMSYGIGHWAYSAPEVMDGFDDEYDHRADIYSLGSMLIELLVGRPPRRRPPIDWRPDVPRDLSERLWAMVDEIPGNRPGWSEIEPCFSLPPLNGGA